MSKQKHISARQAAVETLREAGEPLKLAAIVEGALKRAPHLGGKDPKGTVRSQVILAANAGKDFERVAPGVYGLRDEEEPQQPKPRQRRKAAAKS